MVPRTLRFHKVLSVDCFGVGALCNFMAGFAIGSVYRPETQVKYNNTLEFNKCIEATHPIHAHSYIRY